MKTDRISWTIVVLLQCACGNQRDPEVIRWDASAPLPQLLAEFRLFSHPGELEPSTGSTVYDPLWPLWSNGTSKLRQLVMPLDASVEKTDNNDWSFPLGTLVFKTFSDEIGPIETRVIRNTTAGWEYAVYQWNADHSDAARLDGRLPVAVDIVLENDTYQHEIPSTNQCKTCHESGAAVILGYNAIQLGEQPLPTGTDDTLTNQVIGYAFGNCTHCHNGSQTSDESGFSLLPDAFLANTVNHATEGSGSAEGIRINPGYPEDSVLYLAMSGDTADDEQRSMPPLGVQRRDEQSLTLVETWIKELE